MVVDTMGSVKKPLVITPKHRAPIGSGNHMNLKRRRKSPGLFGLPAPASDLGLIKFNIPGIELDENVENAIGGLGVGCCGSRALRPVRSEGRSSGSSGTQGRLSANSEGEKMVGANELNAAIENYLDKVDDYIVAHSMDDKRGTEVLDPIQEEVDATLDRVRSAGSSSNITSIRVELNRPFERIESALCAIGGASPSALGTLPRPHCPWRRRLAGMHHQGHC